AAFAKPGCLGDRLPNISSIIRHWHLGVGADLAVLPTGGLGPPASNPVARGMGRAPRAGATQWGSSWLLIALPAPRASPSSASTAIGGGAAEAGHALTWSAASRCLVQQAALVPVFPEGPKSLVQSRDRKARTNPGQCFNPPSEVLEVRPVPEPPGRCGLRVPARTGR